MAIKAITANIQGGTALARHMREIEKHLGRGAHVSVGFLEDATYPSTGEGATKLHVAQVAFWNEFGTSTIPSRPFMRDTVQRKSPRWGVSLGNLLRKTNYDSHAALALMGEGIKGQIQASINNWSNPPNSKRWAKVKGFNKPLIHTAFMLRSVDYQVLEGDSGGDDEI